MSTLAQIGHGYAVISGTASVLVLALGIAKAANAPRQWR